MTKMNAVGWFDIYVTEMNRAVRSYEGVLGARPEPMIDPTGETEMMSFPGDMQVYGAAGALVKTAPRVRASVAPRCISLSLIVPRKRLRLPGRVAL